MDISYYADSRGTQDVYDWIQHIKKQDKPAYRKYYQLEVLLKENGKLIKERKVKPPKGVKKLKGTDIWQIRINDYRVLFFYFNSDIIVLTNQFMKKQNETDKNEINRAESRKEKWLKNRNQ